MANAMNTMKKEIERSKKNTLIANLIANYVMTMYDMPTSDSLTHRVKSIRAQLRERGNGHGRCDHDTGC